MLVDPPPTVTDNACRALEIARASGIRLPKPVNDAALDMCEGRTIDPTALRELLDTNRPGWRGDDDQPASIAWVALGGAAGEGWTAAACPPDPFADLHEPELALAAAPAARRIAGAGQAAFLDEVDAYIQAAAASAVRRTANIVRNEAGRIDREARAAAEQAPQRRMLAVLEDEYPAVAAALSESQETFLRSIVDEHLPQLRRMLRNGMRALVRDIADTAQVPFDLLWAAVLERFEDDVEAAVLLFRARVTAFSVAWLNRPNDDDPDEPLPDDVETVDAPSTIAVDVLAVAGGVAVATALANSPTVVPDLSVRPGIPVAARNAERFISTTPGAGGSTLLGPTILEALADLPPVGDEQPPNIAPTPRVVHVWRHRTPASRAFKPDASGNPDAHWALDGVEFTDDDRTALFNPEGFPRAELYAPGDHAGCACMIETILDFTGDDV